MKNKPLLILIAFFYKLQILCVAQNFSSDTLKNVTLIGNLYRKELVNIDSTKLDSLSQDQISKLFEEVNRVYEASNILIKLIDVTGNEIAKVISDTKGQYVIKSNIVTKKIYYLDMYGNGVDQPVTRRRIIYIRDFEKSFLPKYFIKDY